MVGGGMTGPAADVLVTLMTIGRLFGHPITADRSSPIEIPGWGRSVLPDLFRETGFSRGAEIGVWKGGFSEQLCAGMPALDLVCVDPWSPSVGYLEAKNNPVLLEAAFAEAQQRLAPYRCTFLRHTSAVAATLVPDGSLDFVYVDGNHELDFVLEDLATWTAKIRPGGILAGHDYSDVARKPFIQVKAAVDTFTAERGIQPWFLLTRDRTPSFFWVVS